MRELQILFNQPKTWHRIVCWLSWIYLFLPVLLHDVIIKLFCRSKQKSLWSHHATTGKNREIQLKQQTIRCQVLDSLNKIWSRLISINLYLKNVEISVCCGFYNPRNQTDTSCRAWTQPTSPKLTQIFDTQGQPKPNLTQVLTLSA